MSSALYDLPFAEMPVLRHEGCQQCVHMWPFGCCLHRISSSTYQFTKQHTDITQYEPDIFACRFANMQSSLLKGKRFMGDVAQLGRGNGTTTQALFKGGTKQLKKASPSKPAKQASKAITQTANKFKPKGANKKLPVAPAGGRRGRGGKFQGDPAHTALDWTSKAYICWGRVLAPCLRPPLLPCGELLVYLCCS